MCLNNSENKKSILRGKKEFKVRGKNFVSSNTRAGIIRVSDHYQWWAASELCRRRKSDTGAEIRIEGNSVSLSIPGRENLNRISKVMQWPSLSLSLLLSLSLSLSFFYNLVNVVQKTRSLNEYEIACIMTYLLCSLASMRETNDYRQIKMAYREFQLSEGSIHICAEEMNIEKGS